MVSFKKIDNCIYNLIYTKFNEDISMDNYFSYDLEYPTFYNFKSAYFNVNSNVLKNINTTIKSDVYTFKDGLFKEIQKLNSSNSKNNTVPETYRIFSNYAVTFNKNYILSSIVKLMAFLNNNLQYDQINNYNFDLLTGKRIFLKDIFKPGVDYIKIVTDYVNFKISQNKNLYYENVFIDIPDDQAFYLTDDGIVIYFELDQIAPSEFGVPKFKMYFNKFAPYINPRFYCF